MHSCNHMMYVSFFSNTTGAINGSGTVYPSRASDFITVFGGVRDAQSLVFYVIFGRPLFVFCSVSFSHCIVWVSSDLQLLINPHGFFRLFLPTVTINKNSTLSWMKNKFKCLSCANCKYFSTVPLGNYKA